MSTYILKNKMNVGRHAEALSPSGKGNGTVCARENDKAKAEAEAGGGVTAMMKSTVVSKQRPRGVLIQISSRSLRWMSEWSADTAARMVGVFVGDASLRFAGGGEDEGHEGTNSL
jgi:hypothetical protein